MPIRARRAVPLRSNTRHTNKEQRLKLSAKAPRQKQPARSAAVSGANLLRTGRLRPLRAFFLFFSGLQNKSRSQTDTRGKKKKKKRPSGTKRREAFTDTWGQSDFHLLDVVQATGVRLQDGGVVEHLVERDAQEDDVELEDSRG